MNTMSSKTIASGASLLFIPGLIAFWLIAALYIGAILLYRLLHRLITA